jgi:uncharacterized protein YkwD
MKNLLFYFLWLIAMPLQAQKTYQITLYIKKDCPECEKAIKALQNAKLSFEQVSVEKAENKARVKAELSELDGIDAVNYAPILIYQLNEGNGNGSTGYYAGSGSGNDFLSEMANTLKAYQPTSKTNSTVVHEPVVIEEPSVETPEEEPAVEPKPEPKLDKNSMAQQMVDRHNYWRAKLGIGKVRWSEELARYAQEWADELEKRGCDDLEHRPRSGKFIQKYGENLYMSGGMENKPADVVDNWASEQKCYDHNKQECKNACGICGHYTQIIWENTTEIGCAMVRCGNVEIWVCNYNPPGNYIGEKPYKKK